MGFEVARADLNLSTHRQKEEKADLLHIVRADLSFFHIIHLSLLNPDLGHGSIFSGDKVQKKFK